MSTLPFSLTFTNQQWQICHHNTYETRVLNRRPQHIE